MTRRGLTLVELLVVITIVVILLAATAPLFRAGLEERKMIEATRGLSGIITRAKALAAQNQRPVGIAMERLDPSDPGGNPIGAMQSTQVFLVEVPIPYSGDMDDATCLLRDMNHGTGPDGQWGVANVDDDGNGTTDDPSERGFPGSDDGEGMPETATFAPVLGSEGARVLVNPGDLIRFNFRGPLYQVLDTAARSPVETDIWFSHPETIWGNGANGAFDGGRYGSDDIWISPPAPQASFSEARFQVFRAPERTMAQPYTLPTGTAIDFTVSGLGADGAQFGNMAPGNFDDPIVIMFSPSGEVESVYIGGLRLRPQQPIHLLVGKSEWVSPATVDMATGLVSNVMNVMNFDDQNGDGLRQDTEEVLSNLMGGNETSWVSIGHRNGLVTVSDNATVTPSTALAAPARVTEAIGQAREFAVESQTYGVR